MDSPFEILGIDPDADDDEIVRAYRRRVKSAHPDQGGSVREFLLVQSAYERLEDGYDGESHELDYVNADDADAAENGQAAQTERPDDEGNEDDTADDTGFRVEYLDYEVLSDYGWEINDEDLFEKAAEASLDAPDYGRITVDPSDYLLEAAEDSGYAWPYACRGGACANCAVAVCEGEVEMPSNHVLSSGMVDNGIRLSCISVPETDHLKVVYNVKHLPGLDELRLPAQQFDKARAND